MKKYYRTGQIKTFWLALLACIFLAGCGSSEENNPLTPDSTSKSITGMASKGPIIDGTVNVYAVDADGIVGKILKTVTTAADGTYNADIGTYTGNILVEVTGGTYIDEADPTGPAKNNPGLRALLANVSNSVSVSVTPLTEIAVRYAGTKFTTTNIENANSMVSSIVGIEIISTIPANVILAEAANAKEDQKTYGLMLASISHMAKEKNMTIIGVVDAIKNDLSDDNTLNITGTNVLAALSSFCDPTNVNNKTGVQDLSLTFLDDTISKYIDKPVLPPSSLSDLNKAKTLVADLRNTVLSIYNYNGVGTPGIVETPFNNLAKEMETEITPELTRTMDRAGWIIESIFSRSSGEGTETFYRDSDTLEITFNPDGISGSFIVKNASGTIMDSGTLKINDSQYPTSGELKVTMKTESGTLTTSMNFTGIREAGLYNNITFTGFMTAPGFSLDFSEEGRKLHATFAKNPESDDPNDIYPTSIMFSGRITTRTSQMDGTINIPSIVWASRGRAYGYTDWQYTDGSLNQVEVCDGEPRPMSAKIAGSFSELKDKSPTGVKFTGTISGKWNNAFSYDGCNSDGIGNFPQWDASFEGKIEAPSRPVITTSLKVTQSEYRKIALDVAYSRTNTDGTTVFLSGNGTMEEKRIEVERCDYWGCFMDNKDYMILQATLKNQDGMNLNIFLDESKSNDDRFTGSIATPGGAEMADLYTINGVPTVKYIDYFIESIF